LIISTSNQASPGAHIACYSLGTRDSFLGVKWPGHEDDHSPSSTAKVKNGSYMSALPVCLHGMYRGNFTCNQNTYAIRIIIFVTNILMSVNLAILKAVKKPWRVTMYEASSEHSESK
jgi:hypothetical protein